MTEAGRDDLARHFQVLATITREQRIALDREAQFTRAVVMDGGDASTYREAMFERLAQDGT